MKQQSNFGHSNWNEWFRNNNLSKTISFVASACWLQATNQNDPRKVVSGYKEWGNRETDWILQEKIVFVSIFYVKDFFAEWLFQNNCKHVSSR